MEKTITTGTEITFTKTNDKFELIQNPAGFDVKQIKLSKNIPHEPYTFQELLLLYESGKITIEGFEKADTPLIKSILTNYIHTTEIETMKEDITRITGEKEALEAANQQLTASNNELINEGSQLKTTNQELTTANTELASENKTLKDTNVKLNTALEAMDEEK